MLNRLARSYAVCLFATQLLVFIACFTIQIRAFIFPAESVIPFAGSLFTVSIVVLGATFAFVKDSARWMPQVKACPKWMWRFGLGIWIYGFVVFLLKLAFPSFKSPFDDPIVVSAFPFGFGAVSICILYAALWRAWLNEAELKKGAAISFVFICVGIVFFGGFFSPHFSAN